jgi:ABC-type multidrug transport system permease subunit
MVQTLILYWFVGLSNTVTQFFIFYFILYLVSFNGMSLGLLAGSLSKDQRTAVTLAPALAQAVALLSGYFKNLENIPMWIGWIEYLSPMRYSYEAFTEN